MFFPALLIAIGLAILFNTLGIFNGMFWGFFWAIFFIALGIKIMMKRGKCPMCGWGMWHNKMHDKIHSKMEGHCCDHDHEEMEGKE